MPPNRRTDTTMLISLIRMFRDYMRRRTALAELARLDERTLRDLGLVRNQLPQTWGAE
jgi:uncharacterized protein YjiS (DUF1127 family)